VGAHKLREGYGRAMPEHLTAEQAAALLEAEDTLGIPLGPGQPPAFMREQRAVHP
jgi:hypothetical protein